MKRRLTEEWVNIKEFTQDDRGEELFCYLPMEYNDRKTYREDVLRRGDKEAVGATHWAIFITVPEEFRGERSVMFDTQFVPKVVDGKLYNADGDYVEVDSITWWDMCVGACVEFNGETYIYCPEFTYDWWQATYTMDQVYAVAEALKMLMQEDRYVNGHYNEWNRVWELGEYPEHEFIPKQ